MKAAWFPSLASTFHLTIWALNSLLNINIRLGQKKNINIRNRKVLKNNGAIF